MLLTWGVPVWAAPITVGNPFDITCWGNKLGTITIDKYDIGPGNTPGVGPWDIWIEGGFDKTADPCPPGETLIPGTKFYWVQARQGGPTLYAWQNTTDWYIDRKRKADDSNTPEDESKIVADGSPFYVNLRGPGYGHSPLGYQDIPYDSRHPVDKVFETALVCSYDKQIEVIDSFTWGYEVTAGKLFTKKGLNHHTVVSNNLINAFKNDPDPMFGTWDIERGCCCTPEVSSMALLLAALPLVLGWRRRHDTPSRH